jgi:hypothetical protein
MIQPWTVDAAIEAHRDRPGDGRIREALCVDAGADCGTCGGRLLFSDCGDCGLDVPPCRNVFALRRRGVLSRLW